MENRCLPNIDFQLGVGMIVAPIPIGLPVSGPKPIKILVFAMSFREPHAIRPILMVIPNVLVMMPFVLVMKLVFSFLSSLLPMVVLSLRSARRNRDRGEQRGAQKAYAVVPGQDFHAR
jgi:hypothetical protein